MKGIAGSEGLIALIRMWQLDFLNRSTLKLHLPQLLEKNIHENTGICRWCSRRWRLIRNVRSSSRASFKRRRERIEYASRMLRFLMIMLLLLQMQIIRRLQLRCA